MIQRDNWSLFASTFLLFRTDCNEETQDSHMLCPSYPHPLLSFYSSSTPLVLISTPRLLLISSSSSPFLESFIFWSSYPSFRVRTFSSSSTHLVLILSSSCPYLLLIFYSSCPHLALISSSYLLLIFCSLVLIFSLYRFLIFSSSSVHLVLILSPHLLLISF